MDEITPFLPKRSRGRQSAEAEAEYRKKFGAHTEIPADDPGPFLAFAIEIGFDRKTLKKSERHIAVALAVLARLRANREALVNTPTGVWHYSTKDGWSRCDKQWLNVQIEIGCIESGINSDMRLINEARGWLLRQPELQRDRAPTQDRKRPMVR